jgi:small subunit ribosomal protein S6e
MTFKINIGTKSGKTYKLEVEENILTEKKLHDKIPGNILKPELEGYEFEIVGTSDKSGFTSLKGIPGIGLSKALLSYEKGMHKRPKREGKTEYSNKTPKGLRLRKTVRGEVISAEISQINLKILKEGSKKLEDVFKAAEPEKPAEEKPAEAPKETPAEAPKEEPKKEEAKAEEKPAQ